MQAPAFRRWVHLTQERFDLVQAEAELAIAEDALESL
jgi:hypothetical protein